MTPLVSPVQHDLVMGLAWYSCHRASDGHGDAACCVCGQAVWAQPVPPAERIRCDACFDAGYWERT